MASDKSRTEQKNTLSQYNPTDTPDISALRGQANQTYDYAAPVRNSYARAEQRLDRSFNNPLGAATTADIADKTRRAQESALHQDEGIDLASAANQANSQKFGQMATVAGLTAPHVYTSDSTSAAKWTGGDTLGAISGVGGGLLSAF